MYIKNNVLYDVHDCSLNKDGSFSFPEEVTAISKSAFALTTKLRKIVIPEKVTYIEPYAFFGCEKLKSVVLPEGIRTIGPNTFTGCKNLKKIVLPNSITRIEHNAFKGCRKLKSPRNVYKAFDANLTCIKYQFRMNEWSENIHQIRMCKRGYHYSTNLFELFDYYAGKLDKDIIICTCKTGRKVKAKMFSNKHVTNRIKPVRRLTREEIIATINS